MTYSVLDCKNIVEKIIERRASGPCNILVFTPDKLSSAVIFKLLRQAEVPTYNLIADSDLSRNERHYDRENLVEITTFESFAEEILRQHGGHEGLTPSFIVDDGESASIPRRDWKSYQEMKDIVMCGAVQRVDLVSVLDLLFSKHKAVLRLYRMIYDMIIFGSDLPLRRVEKDVVKALSVEVVIPLSRAPS